MEYEDFEVRIRSDRKGGFEVEAVSSPPRVSAVFELPFQPDEADSLLRSLEEYLRSQAVARGAGGQAIQVQDIGKRLFDSLFHGDVGAALEKSLAWRAGRGPAWGVRVRLVFESDDPRLAAVRALPWELLLRDHLDFLTRQRIFALARFIEVAHFFPPPEADSKLRVLVVSSAPPSGEELDLGLELKTLRQSLGEFEVEVLEHPTISTLRPALLSKQPHVLHFIGHGGFDDREGGFVQFESEDGPAARVTAMNLAENVKHLEALRLVVLNSCSGGAWPRRAGQDPFSSVAPALLLAGVPAVVAMQLPIFDDSAIAFSKAFYERLAAGELVETAVAEGRLAIYNHAPASFEWATPVLFLATREGRILDRRGPHPPAPSPGPPESPAPGEGETTPRPLRLGIRSFSGPGSLAMNMEAETDRRLVLDDLVDVFPRLQAFLMTAASERGPIEMSLAAHASIAFAAGYCLGAKSGLDITIRQRGRAGVRLWRGESISLPEEPLWQRGRETRQVRRGRCGAGRQHLPGRPPGCGRLPFEERSQGPADLDGVPASHAGFRGSPGRRSRSSARAEPELEDSKPHPEGTGRRSPSFRVGSERGPFLPRPALPRPGPHPAL